MKPRTSKEYLVAKLVPYERIREVIERFELAAMAAPVRTGLEEARVVAIA